MQKDFRNERWEEFNRVILGKKIWIWGCGVRGVEIATLTNCFASGWNIAGYIDSNPDIESCEGYRVYRPDYVKSFSEDDVILISVDRPGEIAETLEKMGFTRYYSYFWLNRKYHDVRYDPNIDNYKAELDKVRELLSDEESIRVLEKVIWNHKNGLMDYTAIWENKRGYFDYDFFSYGEEVLVDAGAFTGDTVEEYMDYVGEKCRRIYSFEPDENTMNILRKNVKKYGEKVQCYPYGLYDKTTTLSFKNDNIKYSSYICEENDATSKIDTVALDEFLGSDEIVTFIKMDIEGAEVAALNGAKNIIKKYKPKLAICVYHKPADLWEIPLLIHSMVPEYKMYLRHCAPSCNDTVLFCTAEKTT